jgi:hypothetical protein
MLDTLRFQNFKSWRDTGDIRIAPITGFFGTNSSGKSSILQFLLMLKQTVESNDQQQVLNFGSDRTYVDLGTSYDILHQPIEQQPQVIEFAIGWHLSKTEANPTLPTRAVIMESGGRIKVIPITASYDNPYAMPMIGDPITGFKFEAAIAFSLDEIKPQQFSYHYQAMDYWSQVGMSLMSNAPARSYQLIQSGVPAQITQKRDQHELHAPTKFYGFPGEARLHFQSGDFLQTLSLSLEQVFRQIYYLGPLRDFPKRSYTWSGEKPQDVGRRGELTISALLAAQKREMGIEAKIARWLKKLGLVHDFIVRPIAPHRRDYEVRLVSRPNAKPVLITDVGFGVSQILPVLVLCYYAPPGSTVILEQPEIHLHPSVQAGLADVFVEVARERNLQIIVESHSEHLLRRLQRRIAEAELITHEETALYFCDMDDTGASQLTPLALDEFGNINNWPVGFFGDEMGDLVAMSEAAIQRQITREQQA